MRWFSWLPTPVCETLEEKKHHVRQIGNMIQLPFSGDIIKGSSVRSIVVEHGKVIVVEDNGTVHECATTTQEEAEKVRDNIAKDLNVIYSPVWCS